MTSFLIIDLLCQFQTSICEMTGFLTITLPHQFQTAIHKTMVVLLNQFPGHFNAKLWAIHLTQSPKVLHWVHSEKRIALHPVLSHHPLPLLTRATLIQICWNSQPRHQHYPQFNIQQLILADVCSHMVNMNMSLAGSLWGAQKESTVSRLLRGAKDDGEGGWTPSSGPSGVKVQFSPVQHPFFLNPELDFWFSSDKSLNFEPNLWFRSSLNHSKLCITKKFPLKKLFFTILTILTTYLHFQVWSFIKSDLHCGIMTLM